MIIKLFEYKGFTAKFNTENDVTTVYRKLNNDEESVKTYESSTE